MADRTAFGRQAFVLILFLVGGLVLAGIVWGNADTGESNYERVSIEDDYAMGEQAINVRPEKTTYIGENESQAGYMSVSLVWICEADSETLGLPEEFSHEFEGWTVMLEGRTMEGRKLRKGTFSGEFQSEDGMKSKKTLPNWVYRGAGTDIRFEDTLIGSSTAARRLTELVKGASQATIRTSEWAMDFELKELREALNENPC